MQRTNKQKPNSNLSSPSIRKEDMILWLDLNCLRVVLDGVGKILGSKSLIT